jgi:hypothetical protein
VVGDAHVAVVQSSVSGLVSELWDESEQRSMWLPA